MSTKKIKSGWYKVGSTGFEVKQVRNGLNKGKWFVISFNGCIWQEPYNTKKDAVSKVEGIHTSNKQSKREKIK